MAKQLSVKMEDDVFEEAERIVARKGISRNRYINRAVRFYNRLHQRRMLRESLVRESAKVRYGSEEALREFGRFQDEGL